MAFITPYQYYANGGNTPEDQNWGSYQYIPLSEFVNNFMVAYVGNDKLINNVQRHEIIFHAKMAIKKLNYDALRSLKVLELEVGDNLKFILPPDYVNYVRVSLNINGMLRPLTESRRANSAIRYLQDADQSILFDVNNELQIIESDLDEFRLEQYVGPGAYSGMYGYLINGNWYFSYPVGSKYGINTEEANFNPNFRINNGVMDFSSGMSGYVVVLEYVSDGMSSAGYSTEYFDGYADEIVIHKLAEEYMYRYVKWMLLANKINVPMYEKNEAKKQQEAELRNTKIRMKNIHSSRLLMSLRGQSKWIK